MPFQCPVKKKMENYHNFIEDNLQGVSMNRHQLIWSEGHCACFSPLQVILSGGLKIDFSFKIE